MTGPSGGTLGAKRGRAQLQPEEDDDVARPAPPREHRDIDIDMVPEGGAPAADFELFNDDILKICFSFLPMVDLCRVAMVSRQWRAVSVLPDFWKELNFDGRTISLEQVVTMCRKYPGVTTLSLCGVPLAGDLFREALAPLQGLLRLVLGNRFLCDAVFAALARECPMLEHLTVSDAVLGSTGPQDVTLAHPHVREAAVTGCRVTRLLVRCEALTSLSLRRTAAATVVLACPNLAALDMSGCLKLADSAVRSAAISSGLLARLDLSGCTSVGDETLREIAAACPVLSRLDISGCPNVTLEGVRFLSLTHLRMVGCDGITGPSILQLSNFLALEECVADGCTMLSSIALSLPHLRVLSVRGCRKLVELDVSSPRLEAVELGGLEAQGGACSALRRARIASAAVTSLRWRGLMALQSVSLDCPALSALDLSECDELTGAVFASVGEGGGCPALKVLILESCEGLTEGTLNSPSLTELSLVGCKSLLRLELDCPDLRRLQLDGCDRLQGAKLDPVGVSELNLGICPRLEKLRVQGNALHNLELRGCGALQECTLACPQLRALDASYCAMLGDQGLKEAVEECGNLTTLVLAACPGVGAGAFRPLPPLGALRRLDLSYTEVQDLAPVYAACPGLRTLQLSACKQLRDDVLRPVLEGSVLPYLREVDVSYCKLSSRACAELLNKGRRLEVVSMNGCSRLTGELWEHLMAGEAGTEERGAGAEEGGYSLMTLNCVGCAAMRAAELPRRAPALSSLTCLNLRHCAVQRVDLRLPQLTSLQVSNCAALGVLSIECPALGSLYMQACSSLTAEVIQGALRGLQQLETLDVREVPIAAEVADSLRDYCPSLRRLFRSAEVVEVSLQGLLW